jgi:hypothetical protein
VKHSLEIGLWIGGGGGGLLNLQQGRGCWDKLWFQTNCRETDRLVRFA